MAPLLHLDNLSKSFGALAVIDGLSLSLGEGEALGILGPNGAGKSTMFNLITGDLRPSGGRIHFDGRDITRLPAHRRCQLGIGRSYQIPHPFGGMSVFENLLVAAAFGERRKEAHCYDRCVEVLELTELLGKANLAAGSLTLLERKRLELARALATGPRALLLDEIAGGLTESECRELIDTINAIRGNGLSIIWIEHIVHALLAVVERLVVINFGKVIAEGAPVAVMADPAVQEIYLGIEAA
jgi:branched-chain amino acid transport system ATP-binding protein